MAICRGCQAEANRTRTRYGSQMEFMSEVCVECAPEQFGERHDPSDGKVWTGLAAHPEQYEQHMVAGETQYFPTDEYRQDLADTWADDDESRAVEAKRRRARREPSTPEEQRRIENYAREHLLPLLIKQKLNRQYGHTD